MKSAERAKQNSLLDLVALATRFPEKTARVPIFERLIQNIAATIAPLPIIDSQAQQSTKGITLEKKATQAELKITVVRLCNVIVGHAFADKNVALESDLKVLRTKFNTSAQDDFAAVCTPVVDETRKLSAHWLDIGITEMDLQDVETKISRFTEQAPKSKMLQTDKKRRSKKERLSSKAYIPKNKLPTLRRRTSAWMMSFTPTFWTPWASKNAQPPPPKLKSRSNQPSRKRRLCIKVRASRERM